MLRHIEQTQKGSKMDHETLLEEAKEAINKVFGDDSVSKSVTRESLRDLISDIKIMLDTLE